MTSPISVLLCIALHYVCFCIIVNGISLSVNSKKSSKHWEVSTDDCAIHCKLGCYCWTNRFSHYCHLSVLCTVLICYFQCQPFDTVTIHLFRGLLLVPYCSCPMLILLTATTIYLIFYYTYYLHLMLICY